MFIELPKTLQQKYKTYKVLVTGGGTGGHIYPAVAVIEKLLEDEEISDIAFVGKSGGMEESIIQDLGIPFYPILVDGMPRKISFKFLKWFFKFNRAILTSTAYLKSFKPDLVYATGAYVTGPVLFAAFILDIPFILQEGDSYPGLVNRYMSPYATGINLAFDDAKYFLKTKNYDKVKVYGNPLRTNLNEYSREEAMILFDLNPEKKTLVITGGAQGAQTINSAIIEAAPYIINELGMQIIHQTGKKNYEEVWRNLPRELKDHTDYIVRPYFENIGIPLACADVIICRAGSMTLSELCLLGIPSILVPYPHAAADHQRSNAIYMVESGASLYIEDEECSGSKIIARMNTIMKVKGKLKSMAEKSKALGKPDAAENIVQLIKEHLHNPRKKRRIKQENKSSDLT